MPIYTARQRVSAGAGAAGKRRSKNRVGKRDIPSADDVDGETPEQRSNRHSRAKQYTEVANLVVRNVQLLQIDTRVESALSRVRNSATSCFVQVVQRVRRTC